VRFFIFKGQFLQKDILLSSISPVSSMLDAFCQSQTVVFSVHPRYTNELAVTCARPGSEHRSLTPHTKWRGAPVPWTRSEQNNRTPKVRQAKLKSLVAEVCPVRDFGGYFCCISCRFYSQKNYSKFIFSSPLCRVSILL